METILLEKPVTKARKKEARKLNVSFSTSYGFWQNTDEFEMLGGKVYYQTPQGEILCFEDIELFAEMQEWIRRRINNALNSKVLKLRVS